MKKFWMVLFILILLGAVAAVVSPNLRDEIHWKWVSFNNHVEGYKSYLQKHPRGKHATEANKGIDDLDWKIAQMAYTAGSFENYLNSHPAGQHKADAGKMIAEIQSALSQYTRPIEGQVKSLDHSSRMLTIVTSMGDTELLRVTDDTKVQLGETERSLDDLSPMEGVRIDYLNVSDGTLLARKISLGYSVAYCSCGQNCGCPLSRGCRTIRY
jgi:hypothetical protein